MLTTNRRPHFSLTLLLISLLFSHSPEIHGRDADNNNNSNNKIEPSELISGYIPEYRLGHVEANLKYFSQAMNEMILFSVHPTKTGAISFTPGISKKDLSFAQKAKKHGIKRVLLSVGGGGRSNEYPEMTSRSTSRSAFLRNIMELCLENNIDGVDIDWEIPQTQQHKEQLLLLLKEANKIFAKENLYLSVALHYWDVPDVQIYSYVDRINYMTYDYMQQPGGHASFKATKSSVEVLLSSGAPSEKVALGVPAYARSKGDVKTISELHDLFPDLAEDVSKMKGFYFNGVLQCRKKARWAKEKRLAGVFVWEVGQDSLIKEKSVVYTLSNEILREKEEDRRESGEL